MNASLTRIPILAPVLLFASVLVGCGATPGGWHETLLAVRGDRVATGGAPDGIVVFSRVSLFAGLGPDAPVVRFTTAVRSAGFIREMLVVCTETSLEAHAPDGHLLWSRGFVEGSRIAGCSFAEGGTVVSIDDDGERGTAFVDEGGDIAWALPGEGRLDPGAVVFRTIDGYCWHAIDSGERQACVTHPTFVGTDYRIERRDHRLWVVADGAEEMLDIECTGHVRVGRGFVVCDDEDGLSVEWFSTGQRWGSDCQPVEIVLTNDHVAASCVGSPVRSYVWRASDGVLVAMSSRTVVAVAADERGSIIWQVGSELTRPVASEGSARMASERRE